MHKKKILVFPFDLLSHYLRCLALARNYTEYEIWFQSSEKYNEYVLKAGHHIFEAEKFDPSIVMQKARAFDFSWLNRGDIERIFLSQMEIIREHQPAFVIADTAPTLKMAAEKANVKMVALMNIYMSKYYAFYRCVSRNHPAYKHVQRLPGNMQEKITVFAERLAFKHVHLPFRELRKKYQLTKIKSYLDELEGDENLLCDDTGIFPLKVLPANYSVVGPLLHKQETNDSDILKSIDKNKACVCICLGSSGDFDLLKFLNNNIYGHIQFIVAGDHRKVLNAPHFIHKPFLNLASVLPHCQLLICHGGNGTIYEGLKSNTKMFFLTSHFEQEWNAQRLSYLGKGKIINDDPEREILEHLQSYYAGKNAALAAQ